MAAPEPRRDIAGIWPTMALVHHERDKPAGECHLETGGHEQEQAHSVDCRSAEDLLVLLDALRGVFRRGWRLADGLQTVYNQRRQSERTSASAFGVGGKESNGPSWLLNLNANAWPMAVTMENPRGKRKMNDHRGRRTSCVTTRGAHVEPTPCTAYLMLIFTDESPASLAMNALDPPSCIHQVKYCRQQ